MTNGISDAGCLFILGSSWRCAELEFVRGRLSEAMERLPSPTELVCFWESSRSFSGMYVKISHAAPLSSVTPPAEPYK